MNLGEVKKIIDRAYEQFGEAWKLNVNIHIDDNQEPTQETSDGRFYDCKDVLYNEKEITFYNWK